MSFHFIGNMNPDKCIVEARARIIWGEASSSVRDFLIVNGVSAVVADARLKEFELERREELRRIGLRYVLIGAVLASAAGTALWLGLRRGSLSSGITRALALVVLAGVYGLWKVVKGTVYMVRPQAEHKSIPDIEQTDLIE